MREQAKRVTLTKVIGTVLIIYGVSCYLFDYPQERHQVDNGIEVLTGLAFFYLDFSETMQELKNGFLDRAFPNRKNKNNVG